MKALSDFRWRVQVYNWQIGTPLWIWKATTENTNIKLTITTSYIDKNTAERNWECFAKANKIKHWEYV